MEDVQQIIISTLSKAKISHHLSYPIGAKHISLALAATPQLSMLKLHFYSGLGIGLQRGQYEFLRAEYLNQAIPSKEWPISTLYKRPPQYRWEIVVQPVPRTLRGLHRIRQYISRFRALLQVAQWLIARAQLARRGNDILAFFYDDKADELIARQFVTWNRCVQVKRRAATPSQKSSSYTCPMPPASTPPRSRGRRPATRSFPAPAARTSAHISSLQGDGISSVR